jgi:hypothetical protein
LKFYPVIAAIAVIAAPTVVLSAEVPATAQKADNSDQVVCEVTHPPGSRLGGVRRCRTRAEWAQYRAETRDVVHRVQAEGATFCDPNPAGGPHC